jgi:hypothetical protein
MSVSARLAALLAETFAVEGERVKKLTKILSVEVGIIVRWHFRLVASATAGDARMNPVGEPWILSQVIFSIFASTY